MTWNFWLSTLNSIDDVHWCPGYPVYFSSAEVCESSSHLFAEAFISWKHNNACELSLKYSVEIVKARPLLSRLTVLPFCYYLPSFNVDLKHHWYKLANNFWWLRVLNRFCICILRTLSQFKFIDQIKIYNKLWSNC